jgi:hypothetical protein
MFDPDTDEDIYREHSEVECPNCGYIERDVPDVLGFYTPRHPHTIEWSHSCLRCDHEWTETEDLRED